MLRGKLAWEDFYSSCHFQKAWARLWFTQDDSMIAQDDSMIAHHDNMVAHHDNMVAHDENL